MVSSKLDLLMDPTVLLSWNPGVIMAFSLLALFRGRYLKLPEKKMLFRSGCNAGLRGRCLVWTVIACDRGRFAQKAEYSKA